VVRAGDSRPAVGGGSEVNAGGTMWTRVYGVTVSLRRRNAHGISKRQHVHQLAFLVLNFDPIS
jgi:hypothetical protein